MVRSESKWRRLRLAFQCEEPMHHRHGGGSVPHRSGASFDRIVTNISCRKQPRHSEQSHLCSQAMDFPESKGFSKEGSLHTVEGSGLGEVFKTGEPSFGGKEVL